jgi:pimeloyl-ACP methyl ester carboxylesterase
MTSPEGGPEANMTIDDATLLRHRSFTDNERGISEEFLQPRLGAGGTVAVLSRPTGTARPFGWVVCHSFAMEQMHLNRLETRIARSLAGAGFTVLRYQGQGYADSELGMDSISFSSHVAEAHDALGLLAAETGIERIGAVGARLGAMVAAIVAERADLPLLAMIEPVSRGAQYMREFIRSEVFSGMTGAVDFDWTPRRPQEADQARTGSPEQDGKATRMLKLRDDLAAQGWVDIKGFKLTRTAHDEVSKVDLIHDLQSFGGSAFIASVSRTGKPNPSITRLAEHLVSLGAECVVERFADRLAAQFGMYHYAPATDRSGEKGDTQFQLAGALAAATAAWAARTADGLSRPALLEREPDR